MKPIIICACSSRSFVKKETIAAVASAIEQQTDYTLQIEADLCNTFINRTISGETPSDTPIILACHSRAIRSHLKDTLIRPELIINMRNKSVGTILKELNLLPDSEKDPVKSKYMEMLHALPHNEGKDAWYPVIDKDRCTDCGKCHDFCLFGVYTYIDQEIKVVNPQNCKNNCPACARMCPSKAIIFPKYDKSYINGGMEEEEHFNMENLESVYQERLRYKLQQRRQKITLLKRDNP